MHMLCTILDNVVHVAYQRFYFRFNNENTNQKVNKPIVIANILVTVVSPNYASKRPSKNHIINIYIYTALHSTIQYSAFIVIIASICLLRRHDDVDDTYGATNNKAHTRAL